MYKRQEHSVAEAAGTASPIPAPEELTDLFTPQRTAVPNNPPNTAWAPKALEIISENAAGISRILIAITINVIMIKLIVIKGTITSAVLAIRLIPPEITIKSNTAIIAPVIYCEIPKLFLNPLVMENACGATVRIGTQMNVNTA